MKTLNSKADGVDLIADGHALRWTKQLALRGRARFYDGDGVCSKQRLVVGSDLQRFMANASRLFPGATITTVGDHTDNAPWKPKILMVLNGTEASTLTSKALTRIIGRPWREVSRNVVTPDFLSTIAGLGWRYVSKRGRGGARFERAVTSSDGRGLKSTEAVQGDTGVAVGAL
jgi:hypothetical protein